MDSPASLGVAPSLPAWRQTAIAQLGAAGCPLVTRWSESGRRDMTYDRQALYITWGGTIGTAAGGLETWQTGVHLTKTATGTPPMPTPAQLQDLLDGPIKDLHTSAQLSLSAGAMLAWAHAALIDVDGKYLPVNPVVADRTPVGGAAGTSSAASPQDSLCITLYSGTNFGRANYGRLYLPWWSQLVSTATGRTIVTGVDEAAKTLIDGINTWGSSLVGGTALRVSIMSKLGSGVTKSPTVVRVGDVKDTQRRRRAQIRETYLEQPVAP